MRLVAKGLQISNNTTVDKLICDTTATIDKFSYFTIDQMTIVTIQLCPNVLKVDIMIEINELQ